MKRLYLLTLLLTATITAIFAAPTPNPATYQPLGTTHYSKWGISVYDATLKAPDGKYDPAKPFSLTLTYKLGLNGAKIAEQARKEIERQKVPAPQLDAWQKQLTALIPNVAKGDTLTGLHTAKGTLTLLKNDARVGEITDPALTTAFFNIWLGDTTSDPAQRQKLFGQSK